MTVQKGTRRSGKDLGGLKDVVVGLHGEIVDLPAHAEGHGDVYAVPVQFLDELLGGTESGLGVGVEVRESGVAFEVGCPVVTDAVGEDVGVESR